MSAAAATVNDHVLTEVAPMESVNGTLKVECVHGETFATREQARRAIVQYIGYYNTERRHSALGNVAPAWFEKQWMKTTQIAAEVIRLSSQ